MSKREYFLQKALNLQQQLSEPSTGSSGNTSGGSSKVAAREVRTSGSVGERQVLIHVCVRMERDPPIY